MRTHVRTHMRTHVRTFFLNELFKKIVFCQTQNQFFVKLCQGQFLFFYLLFLREKNYFQARFLTFLCAKVGVGPLPPSPRKYATVGPPL